MEIQNRYNEQMAQRNQERNKELWDYTNYENQKKHMKAAGLNPALMYGMGQAYFWAHYLIALETALGIRP